MRPRTNELIAAMGKEGLGPVEITKFLEAKL